MPRSCWLFRAVGDTPGFFGAVFPDDPPVRRHSSRMGSKRGFFCFPCFRGGGSNRSFSFPLVDYFRLCRRWRAVVRCQKPPPSLGRVSGSGLHAFFCNSRTLIETLLSPSYTFVSLLPSFPLFILRRSVTTRENNCLPEPGAPLFC